MNNAPDRTSEAPRHLVILCHPVQNSFNAAVAAAYCAAVRACGQQADVRDLYAMGFDPVLKAREQPGAPDFALSPDVCNELELVRASDVLVLVYPIWFGTPPAMMKGYVDRVLGAGFSARSMQSQSSPSCLAGKALLSFTSSATRRQWLNERGQWIALRQVFDHYLAHAFSLKSDEHVHFPSIVDGLDARFVEEHLEQVRIHARRVCGDVRADWRRGG